MALIEIKTDLTRVAKALERIADALDRLSPLPVEITYQPSTEEDVSFIEYEGEATSDDEMWRNYGPRSNY